MTQIKTQRYVALDVLRGMTVAGMILVNNPGSWGHIFPPLAHAKWAGCTPTDLVFPFFLFVVGAAMAFSFAKYNEGLSGASVKKLLKRGILIFLVGFGLNWFPFYPTSPITITVNGFLDLIHISLQSLASLIVTESPSPLNTVLAYPHHLCQNSHGNKI